MELRDRSQHALAASEVDGVERSSIEGVTADDSSGVNGALSSWSIDR